MAFKLNGDSIANSILVSEEKCFAALLANGHTSHLATSRYWTTASAITDGTCESRALLTSLPPRLPL